ncbi:hypothetical protein G6O67_005571 [Ophiocordyceps sinensis]|uniref:Uncharacterized protein n=2 Tax=Ophiocordyceps sinensis TaxID=72228 RepID=A0A8H4PRS5_9HYPO|nr:hypothetical protein OCS_04389 [Ophiocordyceps sinensis CO18]KAF4509305.1 hypothetical protein G6O67_005571 [Ophiocordyceps sinensis]
MKLAGALACVVFAASASLTVALSSAQQANVVLAARADEAGFDSLPNVFSRAPSRIEPRAKAGAKKAGAKKAGAKKAGATQNKQKANAQKKKAQAGAKNGAQAKNKNDGNKANTKNVALEAQNKLSEIAAQGLQNRKRDNVGILEARHPYVIFEDEAGSN